MLPRAQQEETRALVLASAVRRPCDLDTAALVQLWGLMSDSTDARQKRRTGILQGQVQKPPSGQFCSKGEKNQIKS